MKLEIQNKNKWIDQQISILILYWYKTQNIFKTYDEIEDWLDKTDLIQVLTENFDYDAELVNFYNFSNDEFSKQFIELFQQLKIEIILKFLQKTELILKNDHHPTNILMNRKAKCSHCGKIVQSNTTLQFFIYRGENSSESNQICKNCGYHVDAHNLNNLLYLQNIVCNDFQKHGPWEYDSFYCGCNGFD